MKNMHTKLIVSGIAAVFIFAAGLATPVSAQTIIELWNQVKTPAAPEIKPVVLEAAKTMLLLLDFNKQVCNNERRPRCIASVPAVEKLTLRARNAKVPVTYSLSAGAVLGDVAPQLAAKPGERSVISGPDKFLGTDLENILKTSGVTTVIVTGTAAHGAVLQTASEAALRGFKVIVPVDGISAEDLYPEQYTVWHLLNAPRVSQQVTVTRTDMITFK
jgi:nicotinamidase-related amidase